ncbi:DUF4429 domain-containing protein [Streptacidiphilus sp. PAMC 29251]
MMRDTCEAQGKRSSVSYDGHRVTIVHNRLGSAGRGTQVIPVGQVTSIRWRAAGRLSTGFLQFTLAGAVEYGCAATFNQAQQPAFEAVKAAVEQTLAVHGDRVA